MKSVVGSSLSLPALRSLRPLDQVRERIRYLHYSIRTEQADVHWVRAFVRFHGSQRHPAEMDAPEGEAFLSWLVNERRVSVSTHKQALPRAFKRAVRSPLDAQHPQRRRSSKPP